MARLEIPPGEGGDAVQIWSLQPELGAAATRLVDAAYNKSILPVRVREAARMRIAQLNDCTVCLAFRADKVRAQGLGEDFYCAVGSPDGRAHRAGATWPWSTPSALPSTTPASTTPSWSGCGARFTDPEILDLTICLSAFLGLGRTLRVLGITETSLTDV